MSPAARVACGAFLALLDINMASAAYFQANFGDQVAQGRLKQITVTDEA
jgi:hypothetical protein